MAPLPWIGFDSEPCEYRCYYLDYWPEWRSQQAPKQTRKLKPGPLQKEGDEVSLNIFRA
jgi:hypothetical protein